LRLLSPLIKKIKFVNSSYKIQRCINMFCNFKPTFILIIYGNSGIIQQLFSTHAKVAINNNNVYIIPWLVLTFTTVCFSFHNAVNRSIIVILSTTTVRYHRASVISREFLENSLRRISGRINQKGSLVIAVRIKALWRELPIHIA
jgi:hypothetical protein